MHSKINRSATHRPALFLDGDLRHGRDDTASPVGYHRALDIPYIYGFLKLSWEMISIEYERAAEREGSFTRVGGATRYSSDEKMEYIYTYITSRAVLVTTDAHYDVAFTVIGRDFLITRFGISCSVKLQQWCAYTHTDTRNIVWRARRYLGSTADKVEARGSLRHNSEPFPSIHLCVRSRVTRA